MGKKVDQMIARVAKTVQPQPGRSRRASAIAILKSKGLIRQQGKHLALTAKGAKT